MLLFTLWNIKGAYRDDNGKPVVLECVREAERRIAGNMNMYVCVSSKIYNSLVTISLWFGALFCYGFCIFWVEL